MVCFSAGFLIETSEIDAGVKVYELYGGLVEGGRSVPLNNFRLPGTTRDWGVSLSTVDIMRSQNMHLSF